MSQSHLFCSVVIPTIDRPELATAVDSVLAQNLSAAAFEMIVVNDSGKPLKTASWQKAPTVTVVTTQRQERSVARNVGAALAKGDYLWFLDDDDWLLPDALNNMLQAAQANPEAVWLAGTLLVVNDSGQTLAEANAKLDGDCSTQVVGGAWLPLQAAIIQATAFFAVGGFNPTITGTEDMDLSRRLAMYGPIKSIAAPVGALRRGPGWQSSTQYNRAPADTRRSRDDILEQPHALVRLRRACDDPYWHGRLGKVILSTINYNWQNRRFFTMLSRMLALLRYKLSVWRSWSKPSFWHGLKADHVPGSLHSIMAGLSSDQ